MKKRYFLIPVVALLLVGCRKTGEAFEKGRYNNGDFMKNYYTEWNGVENVQIGKTTAIHEDFELIESTTVYNNGREYGFEVKNLIKEEDKFSYGYLSKLYDGRLRCDNLTTRSRVQLANTGYATFFPKEYRGSDSFAFAMRGATTINYPSDDARIKKVKIDVSFKFYVRKEGTNIYDVVDMIYENLEVSSDDHGNTTYVETPLDETTRNLLYGADAMSFEFALTDLTQYTGYEMTDGLDPKDNEKEHFCVMMYEVLLPGSSWY